LLLSRAAGCDLHLRNDRGAFPLPLPPGRLRSATGSHRMADGLPGRPRRRSERRWDAYDVVRNRRDHRELW